MKILMVASEAEPYAKTGGLADVIGALPAALAERGHEPAVVLPLYRAVQLENPTVVFDSLPIQMGADVHVARIVSIADGPTKTYFVDYPPYFDREGFYGTAEGDYPDNSHRFLLLSHAAIEIAKQDFQPDLIHCHEWQSGMLPVLLKTVYRDDPAAARLPVLFTIHNLGYQGSFEPSILAELGLPGELFAVDGLEFYGKVSYLKGGIFFADALTTVSEAYAREIQTKEYGHGMDGLLRARRDVLSGVINGVDYRRWDPRTDQHIAAHYSSDDLAGKQVCKRDLLESCHLPLDDSNRPVIGIISRMAMQKGADLLAEAADELMAADLNVVVLGDGDPYYVQLLTALHRQYPQKLGLTVAHDEAKAHKIEAGADLFLMPSRYEPCGLNQMYSMKYGTVPVVRATGGLDDTVDPFDPETGGGTGFKFKDATAPAMMAAIRQALQAYADRPLWKRLMRNGMAQDYSWRHVVPKYEQVYEKLVASHRSGAAHDGG